MITKNFFDHSLSDLEAVFAGQKKERYRAQQVFRWVYGKGVKDFQSMSNLAKDFRSEMAKEFHFALPQALTSKQSTDGTIKFLFDMGENKSVETVIIPSEGRLTLCVSSEVGCNMACKFCYTGKQKLQRRLTAAEIVGQYLQANEHLIAQGVQLGTLVPEERESQSRLISNIVFMGMGEPLDNPDAVFKAIEILTADWGVNISKKKITVSTSGIVPMISKVTESGVRLAVSLNGVNDEVREQIMPINKRWPLKELLEACREHCRESGDKVTFEYVLLKGVTDSLEDAKRLHRLTQSVPCKVNIIPFNEHPDSGFHRPDEATIQAFHAELMRLGSHVLRRRTMGRDIYAACGQLISAHKKKPPQLEVSL